MSRTKGQRGLLIVAFVLLLFVLVADLLRTDSVLRRAWDRAQPSGTPLERVIEQLPRSRARR